MKLTTPNSVVFGIVFLTALSVGVVYLTGTLSTTITIMAKSSRTVFEQQQSMGVLEDDTQNGPGGRLSVNNNSAEKRTTQFLRSSDLYRPSIEMPTAVVTTTPLGGKFEQIGYNTNARYHQPAPVLTDGSGATSDSGSSSSTIVVPLMWHVPRSGGTFLKDFMTCLNMTIASESGKYNFSRDGGSTQSMNTHKTLDILSRSTDGQRYVNIDVSTPEGIHEAHRLGFVDDFLRGQPAGMETTLIIVTSYINSAARWLFPEMYAMADDADDDYIGSDDTKEIMNTNTAAPYQHRRYKPIKGLLLTILRHPIERAASHFQYLKYATNERMYHPEWQNLSSILEWTEGEDNWMVRFLSGVGELSGREANHELEDNDLERAKAVLSNYTLIGLTDRMGESLDRFGAYLGWDQLFCGGDRWSKCRAESDSNSARKFNAATQPHDSIQPNSPEWNHLLKQNQLDMKLYEHAVELFRYQGETLFNVSVKAD